jgi:hypothetical protein
MKIINWNVGRPTSNKAIQITEKLIELDADIVILTETNSTINLGQNYKFASTEFIEQDFERQNLIKYKNSEHRASIYSKYHILKTYITYDKFTSICLDLDTPLGIITFYATIIGVFGGLNPRFTDDLTSQIQDFEKFLKGKNACIIGDYNITTSGRVYPSNSARETLNSVLQNHQLINLTASIDNNVDHISISKHLVQKSQLTIETWNLDKSLSDHIGIMVSL